MRELIDRLTAWMRSIRPSRGPGDKRIHAFMEEANELLEKHGSDRPSNLKRAIRLYGKVLAASPDRSAAWNNRGYALMELKRYRKAIRDFTKALTLDRRFSAAHSNVGYCRESLGHRNEALLAYRTAVQCDPSDKDARQAVADIREGRGRPESQPLFEPIDFGLGWLSRRLAPRAKAAYLYEHHCLDLPDEQVLEGLSHRAKAAFATRCARYTVGIAKPFLQDHLSRQLIRVLDEALADAERFAANEAPRQRQYFETRAQRATIAKVAMELAKAADARQLAVGSARQRADAVRLSSAALAAWAVDFAARIEEPVDHTYVTYLAMVYAASAHCQYESARLLLAQPAEDTLNHYRDEVSRAISQALSDDFDFVAAHSRDSYPPDTCGKLRVTTESGEVADRWRDVRVFASSTFRDMQVERDYLRDDLFPRLTDALKPYRIRPVLDDLRWRLPSATTSDEQAGEIIILQHCFDEICDCPFFIALLGERYGSVFDAEKVVRALPDVDFDVTGLSVTALEIMYALANGAHCFFYDRLWEGPSYIEELPSGDTLAAENKNYEAAADEQRLTELRETIQKHDSVVIRKYTASNTAGDRVYDLRSLGELVFHDLFSAMLTTPVQEPAVPQPTFSGDNPEAYCKEYLERHRSACTPGIVAAIAGKHRSTNSYRWLDTVLDMIVRLDRVDSAEAAKVGGVASHTISFILDLPDDETGLYQKLLQRCEERIDPEGLFVSDLLRLISVSPDGLRESDLSVVFDKVIGRSLSALQFAQLRFQLARRLTQNPSGAWQLDSAALQDAVTDRYGAVSAEVHLCLGGHFASLPPSDPRRIDSIRHFAQAVAIDETVALFGAYAGDPGVQDAMPPWLQEIGRFIADEILRTEGHSEQAAEWFCRSFGANIESGMTMFRFCDRVETLVLPWIAGRVSIEMEVRILTSCRRALQALYRRTPEESPGHSILFLGDDDDDLPARLRDQGWDVVDLEEAEEILLNREMIRELLDRINSRIDALHPTKYERAPSSRSKSMGFLSRLFSRRPKGDDSPCKRGEHDFVEVNRGISDTTGSPLYVYICRRPDCDVGVIKMHSVLSGRIVEQYLTKGEARAWRK